MIVNVDSTTTMTQDPGISLLMLLINVDRKTSKIWLKSDTNVDNIGIKSGPSPILLGGWKRWLVVTSDTVCGQI